MTTTKTDRGSEHETYTVIQRSALTDEHALTDHLSMRETHFADLGEAVAAWHNVSATIPLDGDEWVVADVERWWRPGARGRQASEVTFERVE